MKILKSIVDPTHHKFNDGHMRFTATFRKEGKPTIIKPFKGGLGYIALNRTHSIMNLNIWPCPTRGFHRLKNKKVTPPEER